MMEQPPVPETDGATSEIPVVPPVEGAGDEGAELEGQVEVGVPAGDAAAGGLPPGAAEGLEVVFAGRAAEDVAEVSEAPAPPVPAFDAWAPAVESVPAPVPWSVPTPAGVPPVSVMAQTAEPLPVPEVKAPRVRRRRNWLALLVGVGIPALVAILAALAVVLWLRYQPAEMTTGSQTPDSGEAGSATPGLPGGPAGATGGGMQTAPGGGGQMGMPGEPGGGQSVMPGMPGGGGPDSGQPTGMPGGGMAPNPMGGGGMGGPGGGGMPRPGGRGDVGGSPTPGKGASVPKLPGSWPGFRGGNLDGISKETVALAKTWPASGPKRLWSATMGEGHAGAAVANGSVYVLDYDMTARADKLRCLSLADGKELWGQAYPVELKRNHGLSRTVPAVLGCHVVTMGPKLHVMCADANTGAVRWRMDLVRDFGAKVPAWYGGQCPLIDGSKVILAPGGAKALMVAVDLATGKVAWQTPNPRGWTMTHVSVVPATIGGRRMYVYCGSGGVVGVDAKTGAALWETTEWTVSTATVPSPVPIGDGRIFLCGGYNSGAMMIRVTPSGGRFGVQTVFKLPPSTFGSDQQTPVLYKGNLYGVAPGGQLACLDLNGKRLWASGTERYGLGPYMIAGGMIYVLSDRGELAMVQATAAGYKRVAKAKVLGGPDAWGPMALAGGRLIVRDLTTMACLNVAQTGLM